MNFYRNFIRKLFVRGEEIFLFDKYIQLIFSAEILGKSIETRNIRKILKKSLKVFARIIKIFLKSKI